MFQISPVTREDLKDIIELRDEATEWLHGLGTDQWQQAWPDAQGENERLESSIDKGNTWIVRDGPVAVATFVIDTFSDPQLWTEDEQAEPALYIHRFIVRRDRAGIELGATLMDLIEVWAKPHEDYEGYDWLRVDVWTTNEDLHKYYRRIGFDYLRTVPGDYPSSALFQREVPKRAH